MFTCNLWRGPRLPTHVPSTPFCVFCPHATYRNWCQGPHLVVGSHLPHLACSHGEASPCPVFQAGPVQPEAACTIGLCSSHFTDVETEARSSPGACLGRTEWVTHPLDRAACVQKQGTQPHCHCSSGAGARFPEPDQTRIAFCGSCLESSNGY